MITRLYVKIGDRLPHQVIEQLETLTNGVVMNYTLEGALMGMKISHDLGEDFSPVPDVELIAPEYYEPDEDLDDDDQDGEYFDPFEFDDDLED